MRYVTAALFAAAFLLGVTADPLGKPPFPDVMADKYMAMEAVTGGDPHVPVPDLAAEYGYAVPGMWDAPAARTPGALLLSVPALAIPDEHLLEVAQIASVLSVLAICAMAVHIGRLPLWVGGVAALLLVRSTVMLDQYSWGNSGMWVAVLVVAAWWLLPSRWAGVLLGAAAVVKAWPAVVVLVLFASKETRRAGWWGIGTGAALTGAGLLLPGTSITGTVASVTGGASYAAFPSNMSAVGLWGVTPVVGLLIGVAVVLVGLPLGRDWRMTAAVAGGLLASPIAWPRYWLAAVPILFLVLSAVQEKFWPIVQPSQVVPSSTVRNRNTSTALAAEVTVGAEPAGQSTDAGHVGV